MPKRTKAPIDVDGLRGRDLWNYLFGPHHEPALQLSSKNGFKTGSFPTMKGHGHVELLETKEEIVHDFLYLAETDFDVVKIVSFPMQAIYWIGDEVRTHIADVALGHRDGSITFVDVRRFGDIESSPGARERAHIRAEHYREQHGCTYVMHDETKVYPEPLFSNAKEMCDMARPQGRLAAYDSIRTAVLKMPLTMTIHQIMQASPANAMVWRYADEPPEADRILGEINPVYEIVLELAERGDLWIDESRAFALDTMVHFTEFTGVRRGSRFEQTFLRPHERPGEGR
ncbi:hypothetical protein [Rhizobium leguminosarum]|uniref:hypothetical protein n=1 Tax=Rhizobium leguminosarum TaxID=384 RepID=UPI001C9689DF|nr:hypothetical protein [Rhizobium leguminosarum]MBY5346016.1 hypothetical protein [Rhizobium leguminosarum]